jgi:protein-disulfide isomerase
MKRASILIVSLGLIAGLFFVATKFLNNKKENTYYRVSQEKLIKPYSPKLGPDSAKVKLVEFLDPECESCAAFYPVVKNMLKQYEGQVQLVVRYMLYHGNSQLAALATEAAGKQGKYWEMQEALFSRAQEWTHQHTPQTLVFEKFASELDLDLKKFKVDIDDKETLKNILSDFQEGASLGVKGTPTIFVNGRQLFQLSPEVLKSMIEEELKN